MNDASQPEDLSHLLNDPPPQPVDAMGAAAAAFAARDHGDLTIAEQKSEVVQLERTALDALCAITAALQLGLVHFVGISQIQGRPLVELSVSSDGKQTMLPFRGPTAVEAFFAAGKEIHEQLMLLHGKTGKLDWYAQSALLRRKLRENPAIIIPNGN